MKIKFAFISILFAVVIIFFVPKTLADSNFNISSVDNYNIQTNGTTYVSHVVSIVNKTKYVYTPTYAVNVGLDDLQDVAASNSAGILNTQIVKKGSNTQITVYFPKKNIGTGQETNFVISYSTQKILKEKNTGYEVVIPGLANSSAFSNYQANVIVPSSFNRATIVAPPETTRNKNAYTFTNSDSTSGIYMFFKKGGPDQDVKVTTEFPENVIFGLPINGIIKIENTTDQVLKNKDLTISSALPPKNITYVVDQVPAYSTKFVAVKIANPPLLTMGKFKVTILFDGNTVERFINVGFLPDYYLLSLGGIIICGSFIVAYFAYQTWRLHFQKR